MLGSLALGYGVWFLATRALAGGAPLLEMGLAALAYVCLGGILVSCFPQLAGMSRTEIIDNLAELRLRVFKWEGKSSV